MSNVSRLLRRVVLPVTRLHVPFVSAKLSRTVERYCDDRKVSCRARGLRWELDLNELIDHRIFYLGTHERFTTKRILDALPSGGTFFDVGANMGYFTTLAAKQVGPAGKVVAFEPMSRALAKLNRHVAINDLGNVTVEKLVLTDHANGPIEVAFQNSWYLYDHVDAEETRETIPTTTLDDYIASHDVTRIDAMKIDVDGYELKVLSGGQELLRRFRPHLFIELGKYTLRSAGDSLEALLDLLGGAGYQIFSEVTMQPFSSMRELVAKIPEDRTLNVVCRAA